SVLKLKAYLDLEGIRSKERASPAGKKFGGKSYSRGALYRVFQNRIYVGEIPHRGNLYPGQHPGIIPTELWEQVQAELRSDSQGRRNGLKLTAPACCLACCTMGRAIVSLPPTR